MELSFLNDSVPAYQTLLRNHEVSVPKAPDYSQTIPLSFIVDMLAVCCLLFAVCCLLFVVERSWCNTINSLARVHNSGCLFESNFSNYFCLGFSCYLFSHGVHYSEMSKRQELTGSANCVKH